jgi:hypothetical protein
MAVLLAAPEGETVVSAKVTLLEAGGMERASRVSFARGSRSLTLVVPASFDAGGGDFVLLFEPAAGAARVALRQAQIADGRIVAEGLPGVAGVVALIRSPLRERDDEGRVIYAPEGFGAAWRLGVVEWYGAFTTGAASSSPLALTPRMLEGEAPLLASGERARLTRARPLALVPLVRERVRTELVVPCGAQVEVISDGLAELEASMGGEVEALGFGEAGGFRARCDSASEDGAALVLRGHALGGRKAYAIVRLVEDS